MPARTFFVVKISRGVIIEQFEQNLKRFLNEYIEINIRLLKKDLENYNIILKEREKEQKALFENLITEQEKLFNRHHEESMKIHNIKLDFMYFQGMKDCVTINRLLASDTEESQEFLKLFQ